MATAATKYTQDNRSIALSTPLGKDVLLLEGYSGREGLSQLFRYELQLLAEDPKQVAFDKLLGKSVSITVVLPGNKKRYLSGIVSQVVQGDKVPSAKKETTFVRYRAEIVPEFWLLTKKVQSRIFQQLTVPDILKKVLEGLKVKYEFQGKYEKRDYCVQYRESDFAFASRLLEDEGMYYFFKHTSSGHEMVLSDSPQSHPDMPEEATLTYEESGDYRISSWEKVQEVRSGKYVVWDYCFEKPDSHFDAEQPILASAKAGTISHSLKVANNDKLEIYEYPGGFTNRFDGVAPGGSEQSDAISKINQDKTRTVKIRMQQETTDSLRIVAASDARQLTCGHKFKLDKHYDGNGTYLLTQMDQSANLRGAYTSGGKVALEYGNRFTCIPFEVPFRPQRTTPRPFIHGTQTATVVGTKGQEIFTDKYGRIKVQFHWDREGKADANSSCWIRVATSWAGQQWGALHIPRIGQEVVVAFLEGDPDQPIVVGSVYNATLMPPYKLPDFMTQSVLKSRSTTKGEAENFNELRFEDKKGEEQVYFHAEKNFDRVVENNDTLKVGSDKADDGSQTIEIWKNRTETIKKGNETLTIEEGNRTETIKKGDDSLTIETGSRAVKITKDDTLTVEGKQAVTITGDLNLEVKTGNYSAKISAGEVTVEAAKAITLKVGGSSIKIEPAAVTIQSPEVKVSTKLMVSGTECTIQTAKIALAGGQITIGA